MARSPLIPASKEQLAGRRSALRDLLSAVEQARERNQRNVAPAMIDQLKGTFSVPVDVMVDWDSDRSHSPMILIKTNRAEPVMPALTERQREVATLISDGLTNREIAERLGIRIATVKDHVHNILARARLRHRNALAAAMRRRAEDTVD